MPQYRCPQCRVIFEATKPIPADEFVQCPRCTKVIRPVLFEPAPQATPAKPPRTARPPRPTPAPAPPPTPAPRRPPVAKPAARPRSEVTPPAPVKRPVPVDDEPEDDRPRAPRRREQFDRLPRKKELNLPLILIVSGAVSLALIILGVGITAWALSRSSSPSQDNAEPGRQFTIAQNRTSPPSAGTNPGQMYENQSSGPPSRSGGSSAGRVTTTAPSAPLPSLPPPDLGTGSGLGGGVSLDLPTPAAPNANAAPPPAGGGGGGAMPPAVLKKVKAATVMIRVTIEEGRASGSGFFALGPGLVLTNAHVVGMLRSDTPPKTLEVIVNSGERDERVLTGKVVAVDRTSDLAAIRLDSAADLPPPLTVASAEQLIETQQLWVFGFPFGERLGKNITVSQTSVSSLRKDADGMLERVQVNGGMNHGNSGGPVVDAEGRVVGIAVAGIEGTQINFAIPGDKAVGLIHGRLSELAVGEAVRKNSQIVVPVTLVTLDPMQSIKKLEVDWWFAPPGAPRPPSLEKPAARPGEVRKTAAVTYQAAAGRGQAELVLAELPPAGQVLWVQPMVVDSSGKPRWAAAVGKPLESPPEPKYVNLTRRPRSGQSALDLTSTSVLRLRKGGEQHSLKVNLNARMQESSQRADALGNTLSRLTMDRFEARFSLDDQRARVTARTERAIQDANRLAISLVMDPAGNITRSQTDVAGMSEDSRGGLERFSRQIRESLDLAAVPMPGGVQPGQRWKARRMLPVIASEQQSGSVSMTYTYLGVRTYNNREYAVVSLAGLVRSAGDRTLSGRAAGTALVDVATGRVMRVTATVELSLDLDFDGESVSAKGSLEVRLARGEMASGG